MQSNTVFINTEEELIAHVNSLPHDKDAQWDSIKEFLAYRDRVWITRTDFKPTEITIKLGEEQ